MILLDNEGQEEVKTDPTVSMISFLNWVQMHKPDQIMVMPLPVARVRKGKVGSKKPPIAILDIPPSVAADLKKPKDEQDLYLLVHVSREAMEGLAKHTDAGLILPAGMDK